MVKARKYVVHSKFDGEPKESDFKIVEEELPPLKNGEYLIKAEYISVDPYLRAYAHQLTPPYDQFSFQVGTVTESKNSDFPVGTKVVSHLGWRDYTIVDPNAKYEFCEPFKLTDLTGTNLKPSVGVGLMGMPGATAYLAFLEVCQPKEGDTVVITGAAGAVGLLVGQIAKIKGCKIIGFAGSDDKVKWLTKEGGFDFAFNYKTADVVASLKKAAPNGVNSYFDNVGGEISSQIMSQLAPNGKVVVVGCISTYNHENLSVQKASVVQPSILFNRLTVKGFIIWDHPLSEWNVAFEDYKKWVKEGRLLVKEHVTEGFDNLVKALLGMLRGENYGKAVVKV